MKLQSLLVAASMAAAALANSFETDPLITHAKYSHFPITKRVSTVNILFHVVAANNTLQGGNVPDGLLQNQVQVMNKAYSPTGITFRIASIDRTINPRWSDVTDGSVEEQQMKQTLRKGGAADLNIYIVTNIGGAPPGYLTTGFTEFPWNYQSKPWKDGSVIIDRVLPGGPLPSNNRGIVMVHEVGHWFGLYNTFQGGCTAPGDYVDDTPFEASPASGCPVGRDTCPQPGVDPIHNYMDYSNDDCRTSFTPGQATRMHQAVRQFRGIAF